VTKDTSATESTLLIQKDVEAPAVNEEAAATTEQEDTETPSAITAIPVITQEDKDSGFRTMSIFTVVLVLVAPCIGFGLAYAIYVISPSSYDAKIAAVKKQDMHWVFAAAVVVARTVAFLNFYPMILKSQVMSGKAGNLRANMYIFKVLSPDAALSLPVVLEDEGDLGRYNRANRSLHHFTENMGFFVVGLYLAGTCFPAPTFVLACIFGLGRVVHQVGYSSEKGYGNHGAGFALAQLATLILEGLLILVAAKGFF